jgi:hypothetical protein
VIRLQAECSRNRGSICDFSFLQIVHTDSLERPGYEAVHSTPSSAELKSGTIPLFFFVAQQPYSGPGRLIDEVSRSHGVRHTTLGRIPLNEGSARSRDLYLTTHDIHNRQTSMPPAGFDKLLYLNKLLYHKCSP